MSAKVYFAPLADKTPPDKIERRLKDLLTAAGFEKYILEKDFVAVKTHFGEKGNVTHIPPHFFKPLTARIKQAGGRPFLVETSTLYKGNRSDALAHLEHAANHGFTLENTGMIVMMADGLKGDSEIEVEISKNPKITVNVAGLLQKIHNLVVVSHPTGHMGMCFGGTIKNLGMGLSSRKGKLVQHSSVKPFIKGDKCTGCGRCVQWCPEDAIPMENKIARIDNDKCIGCGECLTECRYDAVAFSWEMDKTRIQELTAEHARGVVMGKTCFFINYLVNFTKDCDCFGTAKKPIIDDIGLLASDDPVAVDEAAITLIEERNSKPLSEIVNPELDPRVQTRHGEKIGLGKRKYELIEC
jgi:uncharacterized protein